MSEKTYSVMELAEIVGVPRTTINDWLSRHSSYMDFRTIGKRRVYVDSTVAVLKEISELRNKGLSSFEIEGELAKRHVMRAEPEVNAAEEDTSEKMEPEPTPEPQPQVREESPENKTEPVVTEAVPKPIPPVSVPQAPEIPPEQNYALIAKQQSDELGKMIASSFNNMADRLYTLEKQNKSANRKMYLAFVLLIAFVVIASIGVFYLNQRLKEETKTSKQNSMELSEIAGKTSANLKELSGKTVSLAGTTAQVKQGIEMLKKDMTSQKQEFSIAIKEMKNQKESEIAELKEKFAKERRTFLRDLENMSNDKDAVIKNLESELNKLRTNKQEKK